MRGGYVADRATGGRSSLNRGLGSTSDSFTERQLLRSEVKAINVTLKGVVVSIARLADRISALEHQVSRQVAPGSTIDNVSDVDAKLRDSVNLE